MWSISTVTPGSQNPARYAATCSTPRPARSVSSGGKRMSSQASAAAGIWLNTRFGVSRCAMLTVVVHDSAAGVGYRAISRSRLRISLTRALSASHGYALWPVRPVARR